MGNKTISRYFPCKESSFLERGSRKEKCAGDKSLKQLRNKRLGQFGDWSKGKLDNISFMIGGAWLGGGGGGGEGDCLVRV
jgi:hypothetical protein